MSRVVRQNLLRVTGEIVLVFAGAALLCLVMWLIAAALDADAGMIIDMRKSRRAGVPPPPDTNAFIMTWSVATTNTVTVPGRWTHSYAGVINWGDGSGDKTFSAWNDANLSHSYNPTGVFDITITGRFPRIYFANDTMKSYPISVKQLGNVQWAYMLSAFQGCANLTNVSGPGVLTNVTHWISAFHSCSKLTAFDFAGLGNFMDNATNVDSMFNGSKLGYIDGSRFSLSNVVSAEGFLYAMSSLTNVDLRGIGTNCVNLKYLARGVASLPWLDLSEWDVSRVTTFEGMCYECAALTNINISTWDYSRVSSMKNMFYGCSKLPYAPIQQIPASCTTAEGMYLSCSVMTGDVANFSFLSNVCMAFGCNASSEKLFYSHTGGFFSTNIPHGFSLNYGWAGLSTTSVNNVLIDLDTSGATNGTCAIAGNNAAPSGAGSTAKTNLVGKAWTVTSN